ncbi:hypothetical protein AAG570_006178 [Ranatra chinensis]|uniref:Uncharacterized protein n=1 Tax=Ranatra chinensis TaxID=642074 RepID=A0ABD0YJ03_9HEMI
MENCLRDVGRDRLDAIFEDNARLIRHVSQQVANIELLQRFPQSTVIRDETRVSPQRTKGDPCSGNTPVPQMPTKSRRQPTEGGPKREVRSSATQTKNNEESTEMIDWLKSELVLLKDAYLDEKEELEKVKRKYQKFHAGRSEWTFLPTLLQFFGISTARSSTLRQLKAEFKKKELHWKRQLNLLAVQVEQYRKANQELKQELEKRKTLQRQREEDRSARGGKFGRGWKIERKRKEKKTRKLTENAEKRTKRVRWKEDEEGEGGLGKCRQKESGGRKEKMGRVGRRERRKSEEEVAKRARRGRSGEREGQSGDQALTILGSVISLPVCSVASDGAEVVRLMPLFELVDGQRERAQGGDAARRESTRDFLERWERPEAEWTRSVAQGASCTAEWPVPAAKRCESAPAILELPNILFVEGPSVNSGDIDAYPELASRSKRSTDPMDEYLKQYHQQKCLIGDEAGLQGLKKDTVLSQAKPTQKSMYLAPLSSEEFSRRLKPPVIDGLGNSRAKKGAVLPRPKPTMKSLYLAPLSPEEFRMRYEAWWTLQQKDEEGCGTASSQAHDEESLLGTVGSRRVQPEIRGVVGNAFISSTLMRHLSWNPANHGRNSGRTHGNMAAGTKDRGSRQAKPNLYSPVDDELESIKRLEKDGVVSRPRRAPKSPCFDPLGPEQFSTTAEEWTRKGPNTKTESRPNVITKNARPPPGSLKKDIDYVYQRVDQVPSSLSKHKRFARIFHPTYIPFP